LTDRIIAGLNAGTCGRAGGVFDYQPFLDARLLLFVWVQRTHRNAKTAGSVVRYEQP
jgi:hypothetical protein